MPISETHLPGIVVLPYCYESMNNSQVQDECLNQQHIWTAQPDSHEQHLANISWLSCPLLPLSTDKVSAYLKSPAKTRISLL